METITVQVVYEKGVLKPKSKLPFPDKSLLEVQVKPANGKKQGCNSATVSTSVLKARTVHGRNQQNTLRNC